MGECTLTPEQRLKGGKNRGKQISRTRAWYMQQLLDIAMGKRKCTGPQLTALCKFADQRGWYPPAHKKNVISRQNLAKLAQKPAITEELSGRLLAMPKAPTSAASSTSPNSTPNAQVNGQTAVNA